MTQNVGIDHFRISTNAILQSIGQFFAIDRQNLQQSQCWIHLPHCTLERLLHDTINLCLVLMIESVMMFSNTTQKRKSTDTWIIYGVLVVNDAEVFTQMVT